jgi:hypothetical protein
MSNQIRIEIVSRNDFWRNAFNVEWDYQFPERKLVEVSSGCYLASAEWLGDLERVGQQCFSNVLMAPSDPGRREIFRLFLPRDDR